MLKKAPHFAAALLAASAALGAASSAYAACDVIVYRDANFSGEAEEIRGDQAFVGQHWNDQISSIRVMAGRWNFYWDADYRGEVLSYGPGNYAFVGPHWNDQISSLRCVGGSPERGPLGYNSGGYRRDDYVVSDRVGRIERDGERGGHERDHDRHRGGGHGGGGHGGGGHGGGGHGGGGHGGGGHGGGGHGGGGHGGGGHGGGGHGGGGHGGGGHGGGGHGGGGHGGGGRRR